MFMGGKVNSLFSKFRRGGPEREEVYTREGGRKTRRKLVLSTNVFEYAHETLHYPTHQDPGRTSYRGDKLKKGEARKSRHGIRGWTNKDYCGGGRRAAPREGIDFRGSQVETLALRAREIREFECESELEGKKRYSAILKKKGLYRGFL